MRFILGIIVGSLIVLASASALPTGAMLDRAGNAWRELMRTTGKHVFGSPPVATPVNVTPVKVTPVDVPNVTPAAIDVPVRPIAQTAPTDEARPAPSIVPSATTGITPPEPAVAPSTQTAWQPFRNARSARGFAARLQRELDHPFEVYRERAGKYLVVFEYTDEASRDALLERIRRATQGTS